MATLQDVVGPWEVFCRAAQSPGSYEVEVAAAGETLDVETKYGLPIVASRSALEVTGRSIPCWWPAASRAWAATRTRHS